MSLSFDSANPDYIFTAIGDGNFAGGLTELTVAFYYQPASQTLHTIADIRSGSDIGLQLAMSGTSYRPYCQLKGDDNVVGSAITTTATYTVDQWDFWVITWDVISRNIQFYLNGAPIDTTVVAQTGLGATLVNDPDARLQIGIVGESTSPADGRLEYIAFWNRALSAAEIAALYALRAKPDHPQHCLGLLAYYDFTVEVPGFLLETDSIPNQCVNDVTAGPLIDFSGAPMWDFSDVVGLHGNPGPRPLCHPSYFPHGEVRIYGRRRWWRLLRRNRGRRRRGILHFYWW